MTAIALFCASVPIEKGERIGRGGEGEVYAVANAPERIIKLYLKPDPAHEVKVRAMIAAQLADKCSSVAFPLQLVSKPNGSFAGFTMRRVSDNQPIFELFASGSRRERFPRANWAFLVRTAANVARIVAQVHAGGGVIGDINSAGFLVSQRTTVTLIDADSFQVAGDRCRIGMPEYTPSELQGIRFGEIDRTVDHDAFGLAVMIFQLLALGRHPHAGVRNGRGLPLETAITQERFAYSLIRNVGSMPSPAALTLGDLPLGIRTLFERAFALRMGPRPTAKEWVGELAVLEAGLVRCLNTPAHVIPTHAGACPWCRIEKELGRSLFPAGDPSGSAPQQIRTDLHHEVARVVRQAKEHAGEDVQPMWRRSDVMPSKAARERRTGRSGVSHRAAFPAWPGQSASRARVRRAIYERAGRGSAGAGPLAYRPGRVGDQHACGKAAAEPDRSRSLRASRPVLLAQITERAIVSAATERMRTMPIDSARVPGIGASLRSHLVTHGVATAADVTRTRLSTIPGLGEARTAALLLWRDRMMVEAQRSVAGNRQLLDRTIANAMSSVVDQISSAEDALRAQCADLDHRVSKIRKRVWLIDRRVEDALHDRDQAAMDLELLGIEHKARAALSKVSPSSLPQAPTAPKAKKKSRTPKRQPVVCPACGAPIVKRWGNAAQGSNKLFLGCSTYPRCTGSRPVHRKRAGP